MIDEQLWRAVNADLVAKAIGECSYEEMLEPEPAEDGYRLELATGTRYRFHAERTPWTWLRVDSGSLRREGEPVDSAVQFLIDARDELGLDDAALAGYAEEIQNTLSSEVRRRSRWREHTAASLVDLSGPELETLLDGHPKFLANKGRIGWGRRALDRYAPESGEGFRLRYLAADPEVCRRVTAPGIDEDRLRAECLDPQARDRLHERMAGEGLNPDERLVLPVHPWQFERFLSTQYAEMFARGELVDLGRLGDTYRPRQSIRTVWNASRPGRDDVKLPLTILNTSCYRGLPGEHLGIGVALSQWLGRRADKDPELARRNLLVLDEHASVHCPHPRQRQIEGGAYRYDEMLGAVWRESARSRIGEDQQAILLSALMQTDADGRGLVTEYVERSPLDPETWLRELFDTVTVPLYHLLCRYGVGLVAHGQNVGLVLDEAEPARAVLKDFHGDLRLVDRSYPEHADLPDHVVEAVKRFPPHLLVQDLVTGHLVTTLRFVSPIVADDLSVPEDRFYELLGETLRDYEEDNPDLGDRFAAFGIFAEELDKVLVNSVRFQTGFGEGASRPEPEMGTPIPNPLRSGGDR